MDQWTYQTGIEDGSEDAPKKGMAMTDVFQDERIRDNFIRQKKRLNMSDIIDRGIRIVNYEIYEGENNFGKHGEFCRFEFYLEGDDENLHETTSQAIAIKERLKAVPLDYIQEVGGLLTMVQETKTPQGKGYKFAGL